MNASDLLVTIWTWCSLIWICLKVGYTLVHPDNPVISHGLSCFFIWNCHVYPFFGHTRIFRHTSPDRAYSHGVMVPWGPWWQVCMVNSVQDDSLVADLNKALQEKGDSERPLAALAARRPNLAHVSDPFSCHFSWQKQGVPHHQWVVLRYVEICWDAWPLRSGSTWWSVLVLQN